MARKRRIDPKLPIVPAGDPAVPLMQPDRFLDRFVRRCNELFMEFTSTLSIYDEGTYLGEADGVNLIGANVVAAQSATLPAGVYDITVSGSSGSALEVDDEGVAVDTAAVLLNFVGAGVTATSAGSHGVTVTIPGGGSQQPLYVYFA